MESGKENLKEGAKAGKDKIEKMVESGKENLKWGAQKGYEQLERGASAGYDLGSKGVSSLKDGALEAIDAVSNTAANTYNKIVHSETSQKIKEESWNILNSIEKNTIGMIKKKSEPFGESEEELKFDQPV